MPEKKIPDFSLPDAEGSLVRFSELQDGRPWVIFFYPKDETTVCTQEACAFRDHYQEFLDLGAGVIGISRDPSSSHKQFIQRHRLPYHLLSDPDGQVAGIFGVKDHLFGLVRGRETFVLDATRHIIFHYKALTEGTQHAQEALRFLKIWRAKLTSA